MAGDTLQGLSQSMEWAARRWDRLGPASLNPVFGIALVIALLAVLLAYLGGYHGGFVTINQAAALLPDWLWKTITRFGDERVLVMLSLLFARRRPEIFWALIVSALLTVAYSRGLKHLVDAMRPPAVLAAEQFHLIGPALRNHSFPSGHSASVFVFVGVLMVFAHNWGERTALLAMGIAVALSRIALGVHWPQDVLAGAFGGLMAAGLGSWLAFHWRAGLSVRVHRTLALLPLLAAGSLLSSDGGNPSVPWVVYPLVFAMLAQWWKDYGPSRG